jgi:hypothetical protein
VPFRVYEVLKDAEVLADVEPSIPHMVLFPTGQEARGKREYVGPGTARKLTLSDFAHHFGHVRKREYGFVGDFWLEPNGEAYCTFNMPQTVTRTSAAGEVLVRMCGHSSGALRLRNGDKISLSRGEISIRLVNCPSYAGDDGPEWINRTRQQQDRQQQHEARLQAATALLLEGIERSRLLKSATSHFPAASVTPPSPASPATPSTPPTPTPVQPATTCVITVLGATGAALERDRIQSGMLVVRRLGGVTRAGVHRVVTTLSRHMSVDKGPADKGKSLELMDQWCPVLPCSVGQHVALAKLPHTSGRLVSLTSGMCVMACFELSYDVCGVVFIDNS